MVDTAPIPLAKPSFDETEIDAIREVLDSGWVAGQGPAGTRLEEGFIRLTGTQHAVALANCTAALHLAMIVLDVEPGDEVIVADYTYPATGHAVMYTGATPVFADVESRTGLVDPDDVAAAVSERTVGIIGVDLAGQCADWDGLRTVADRHDLFLVEDAACSAGATYRGRPAGSLADIACFSLHARKGITSGEGGVLVTNDADRAARARSLSAFGTQSAWDRHGETGLPIPAFVELGYNYKLSDVQSALALAQLQKLGTFLANRRQIAEWYRLALDGVPGVALPHVEQDRDHTWQTFAVTVDSEYDRDSIAGALRESGIGCNIGTFASHVQPVYGTTRRCPRSADLFSRQLALPMHVGMDEGDVATVAKQLNAALASASPPVKAVGG